MTERQELVAVTGAASGLGAALCARLRAQGRATIGIDRSGSDVDADLGSDAGRKQALEAILERGGGRLDGLVVAAGVGPYAEAEAVISVNYFGSMRLVDGLLEALRGARAPAALTVSSIGAYFDGAIVPALMEACLDDDEAGALAVGRGIDGTPAYSTAKRAIIVATRRRAPQWGAAGVRLNALVPGNMATPMLEGVYATPGVGDATRALPLPLARDGSPDEVAAVGAFLLGEGASYLHGAAVPVDGGVLAAIAPDPFGRAG